MNINVHRAAMHLQKLPEKDQGWVLAQLPPEYQKQIVSVLNEFYMAGPSAPLRTGRKKSSGSYTKDEGIGEIPVLQQKNTVVQKKLEPHVKIIRETPLHTIIPVIEQEPECIVAAVLAYDQWPWLPDYFNSLSYRRRRRLILSLRQIKQNTKAVVIETVAKKFAQRLEAIQQQIQRDTLPAHISAVADSGNYARGGLWRK